MPDDAAILSAVQSELIRVGICRRPGDGPDGDRRPLFIEPDDGAPDPASPEDVQPEEHDAAAMLAIFSTGGIAAGPGEMYSRKRTVEFWIRAAKAQTAFDLDYKIVAALVQEQPGSGVNRTNWLMGDPPRQIRVIESLVWREQARPRAGGNAWISSLMFEVYRD